MPGSFLASDVACGFHLKEYTLREVRKIFAAAGFPRLHAYVGARGWFLPFPGALLEMVETMLCSLPARLRRRLAATLPLRALLGLRVAAIRG